MQEKIQRVCQKIFKWKACYAAYYFEEQIPQSVTAS